MVYAKGWCCGCKMNLFIFSVIFFSPPIVILNDLWLNNMYRLIMVSTKHFYIKAILKKIKIGMDKL